jgi:hypothetical protein
MVERLNFQKKQNWQPIKQDNSSVDFDAYYLPNEDFERSGVGDNLYYEDDEGDCEVEYDIFGNPHLISETKVTHDVRGNPQLASTTKTNTIILGMQYPRKS